MYKKIDLNINVIYIYINMVLQIVDNPERYRENIRKKLDTILQDEKASTNLEIGVFNYAIKEADNRKTIKKWDVKQFVEIYNSRLRSIMLNLNDKWVQAIRSGEVHPKQFAFMTHQDFNYERWSEMIEIKSKRDKNKFEVNIAAATDTFTCRKCKKNQCTYYIQQTRSADEPSTIFIQCINCNNRWRTS
ncbi:MAG: hypothetical protein ACOVRN_07335 [Flavobacterium sp.]